MSALLAEVAEALALHGRLRCVATVDRDGADADGPVVLTVTIDPYRQVFAEPFGAVASAFHELQYVCDLATMRALCEKHGIEKEKLEALLPPKED